MRISRVKPGHVLRRSDGEAIGVALSVDDGNVCVLWIYAADDWIGRVESYPLRLFEIDDWRVNRI